MKIGMEESYDGNVADILEISRIREISEEGIYDDIAAEILESLLTGEGSKMTIGPTSSVMYLIPVFCVVPKSCMSCCI